MSSFYQQRKNLIYIFRYKFSAHDIHYFFNLDDKNNDNFVTVAEFVESGIIQKTVEIYK